LFKKEKFCKKRKASLEIQEHTKRQEGKAAYGMEEISLVDRTIPGAVLAHLKANIKIHKDLMLDQV
jgi:hypothetical protein